ncbi:mucin-19 [Chanos chanos]|uniref:Mucin-19 n=1 Tax=Chanos chanos TaxID=29144 RepID=A0A6J2VEA5_CHACN|nr:mucin-19-like [Chanos chanos]
MIFLALLLFARQNLVAATGRGQNMCKTFGSGVIQPFNGSTYYVRSSCPFTFTHFSGRGVDCDITIHRGNTGLMDRVEIIVNKVMTVLQNGSVFVENKRVSLPYDHTYQHVFHYGIYTKLQSKVLPVSVTWSSGPGGISSLWVELDQELVEEMSGLCGQLNTQDDKQRLISQSTLSDQTCTITDVVQQLNPVCVEFISNAFECLSIQKMHYMHFKYLCEQNIYGYENNVEVRCSFFEEIVRKCGNTTHIWSRWRGITRCPQPSCPGDLSYRELGPAFLPTCSNPSSRVTDRDIISTCVCPKGQVLNDRVEGHRCVNVTDCPCVHAGRSHGPGEERSTKCQTCVCIKGKWACSGNTCSTPCIIEGQYVTTFDGKQYTLPMKCTYVAARGQNWTLTIEISERAVRIETVFLQVNQEKYTFSINSVKRDNEEIHDLLQTEYATVFWESSIYVLVQTYFGMKMQVQISPEVQIYVYLPETESGITQGLCGNNNNDTTDDFTASSGIIENAAQPFALSWAVGDCRDMPMCINRDNEIFADDKCYQLRDPNGIFAPCHDYVPVDYYLQACIQRTCLCTTRVQECLCVALGNYAKACVSQGIVVGDWRGAANCTLMCRGNLQFDYTMRACNRSCRALSGSDPTCEIESDPVEGCGCPAGTHLNSALTCSPKAQCTCHYQGGLVPPGPVVIDGRQCLSKPANVFENCINGCYCPEGQYEDHNGVCVDLENCTCVFSGKVYTSGQSVETNCKICTCSRGQWHCVGDPCPGKCQVYGNGHYQTFDSKWYRFDGNCQYVLVEDGCGDAEGSFVISAESVPCCDELLTCSRTIVVELLGEVMLTLNDMKVRREVLGQSLLQAESLYSVHVLGLYIVISVPRHGLTVIWDKHTRVTILLEAKWRSRVCGLCGNFDANEKNDLLTSGSSEVSSTLEFGNSWKIAVPPCSDVFQEVFPCERHSYCAAWAERRCMILHSSTFADCHLKVDPEPYYRACVLESCSCEFEGKFLGFCTAVAAYAEACSEQNICIKWRTPDLCPVYCDYYNEEGQYSWHYEPCGQIKTCGNNNNFFGKLEGCYPRCSAERPYYDENTDKCTTSVNCTCFFNDTLILSGERVNGTCVCAEGRIICETPTSTTPEPSTTVSTTPETTNTTTQPTTPEPTTTASVPTHPEQTTTTATTAGTTTSSTTHYPEAHNNYGTNSSRTNKCIYNPRILAYHNLGNNFRAYNSCNCISYLEAHNYATNYSRTNNCIYCKDLKRNQTWKDGYNWTEDCFHKKCSNGSIDMTTVRCPDTVMPQCPRGKMREVSDGCCKTWKCDCQCDVYGDPHYISFQGTTFDFLDNCTYILVEERVPRYNLSVVVDNYFCIPGLPGSCAKGIVLKYHNNTITLTIIDSDLSAPILQPTLNQVTIQPPHEEKGIRFESTGYLASVYMDEIRSYVSLTSSNTLIITLAMEYFYNNTQGQCGVCGGGSCVRRSGRIEDETCCDRTAVFQECSTRMDLVSLRRNCEFDVCLSGKPKMACSALSQAAEECKTLDICVDWRHLTNGTCGVPCPKGMVFQECHHKLDNYCNGRQPVNGRVLDEPRAGCFCPENQYRAEGNSEICVSECTGCKGPLGEPKQLGETWMSECHICTCNNMTRTTECRPESQGPSPLCRQDSELVPGCCNELSCVEKTCKYKGVTYKVGDTWRDPSEPCLSLSCLRTGLEVERRVCPQQSCAEEFRVWDEHHCCYTCNLTCAARVLWVNITLENCSGEVELPSCGPGLEEATQGGYFSLSLVVSVVKRRAMR